MNTQITDDGTLLKSTDFLPQICDECEKPAFKVQRDAANQKHVFCKKCWDGHVAFSGNKGKPYGFGDNDKGLS
jgi:hypothetical protein